ncbi:MAG: hypothetical protein FJ320_11770 [SAR202 cluster bacterium]|nr:hypothetical protein [SAR202 cluster bacterium]
MSRAELKVGMPVSLTGAFAPMGRQALAGVRKWVEWANGRGGVSVEAGRPRRPVRLVHYDDGGRKAGVREAVLKLIEKDKVDLLLGRIPAR